MTATKVNSLDYATSFVYTLLVFNFWEPLHYFDKGYGFQTWEVSPKYAIRSWTYVLLHLLPTRLASFIAENDKVSWTFNPNLKSLIHTSQRPSFFAVRIFLAVISTFSEVILYRQVYEKVNQRVGRYLFFMLAFSAGMWNASTGKEVATVFSDPVELSISFSSFLVCHVYVECSLCLFHRPFICKGSSEDYCVNDHVCYWRHCWMAVCSCSRNTLCV